MNIKEDRLKKWQLLISNESKFLSHLEAKNLCISSFHNPGEGDQRFRFSYIYRIFLYFFLKNMPHKV